MILSPSPKETRMFDLIPTQYAKCPTMLNAHCCFVVVVCFVLFWWFGGCTIGYFFLFFNYLIANMPFC